MNMRAADLRTSSFLLARMGVTEEVQSACLLAMPVPELIRELRHRGVVRLQLQDWARPPSDARFDLVLADLSRQGLGRKPVEEAAARLQRLSSPSGRVVVSCGELVHQSHWAAIRRALRQRYERVWTVAELTEDSGTLVFVGAAGALS